MTRKAIAVLLGLAVSLGAATVGCDASKSRVAPRPRVATGLRGVRVRELSCSSKPESSETGVVAIGAVEEFSLCRWGLRGVPRRPLTVKATDPQFTMLLTALSARNAPATTGPCLALSEIEIVLLARTPAGAFRVSIPRDGCGLYQKSALDAIYGAPRNSGS